jgi:hypothetical protein
MESQTAIGGRRTANITKMLIGTPPFLRAQDGLRLTAG